jgi:hypothetical protein
MELRMHRADAREAARQRLETDEATSTKVRQQIAFLAEMPPPGPPTDAEVDAASYAVVAWRAAEIAGHDLSLVPRAARLFYAVEYCHADVCNGGFHQLFSSHTGDLAALALEGFEAIGDRERGALFRKAMSHFPGGMAPRDHDARRTALDAIEGREAFIRPIEDAYYALDESEPLSPMLDAFAALHAKDFFVDP